MDREYTKFEEWLDSMLNFNLPNEVAAINFNLYEDVDNHWTIELVGTGSYDADDEDWACDEVIAMRDEALTIQLKSEWNEILDMFSGYIKEYLNNGQYSDVLKSYKAVAVGFVDGDLNILYEQ